MPQEPKNFTLVDARTFDGDPFDVAERSCQQVVGLLKLTKESMEGARLMVRNAELERQLLDGNDPNPSAWEDGPQGRRISEGLDTVSELEHSFNVLTRAAGFNPKNPPKE